MSNSILRVGVTPRSSLSIPHDYLRVSGHANGGTDALIPYTGRVAGTAISGNWTYNGTTPAWGGTGYIAAEVDAAADTYVLFDDQSLDELFRLDTLAAVGGLLFLGHVTFTTDQGAANVLLEYGSKARADPGGVGLAYNAGGTQLGVYAYPSDNTVATGSSQKAFGGTGTYTFAAYIDCVGGDLTMAYDGDWAGGATNSVASLSEQLAAPTKLAGTTDGDFAFSFFSGHNAGATSDNSNINTTTGDLEIADFWVVRFEEDRASDIASIFTAYNANPREIPIGITY